MFFVSGLNIDSDTLEKLITAFIYLNTNYDILNNPDATMTTLDGYIPGYTYDEFCDKLTAPWNDIYKGSFFLDETSTTQDTNNYPKCIIDYIIMMNWTGYVDYESKFMYKTDEFKMVKRALGFIALYEGMCIFLALILKTKGSVWGRIFDYPNKKPLTYRIDQPATWLKYAIEDNTLFNIGSLLDDFDNTLSLEPFLGMILSEKAWKLAKWATSVNTIPFSKIGTLKFQHLFGIWKYDASTISYDYAMINLKWDITSKVCGASEAGSETTWLELYDALREFPVKLKYLKVRKFFTLPEPTTITLSQEMLFDNYENESLSKLHHALITGFYYCAWADSKAKGSSLLDWSDSGATTPFLAITDRQILPYILASGFDGLGDDDLRRLIFLTYLMFAPSNATGHGDGVFINRGNYDVGGDTNLMMSPFKISAKYTEVDFPEYLGWNQIQDTTDEDLINFMFFRSTNWNMNQTSLLQTWNDAAVGTIGDTYSLWSEPELDITIYTTPFSAPSVKALELEVPKSGWTKPYVLSRDVLNPIWLLYGLNNYELYLKAPGGGGDGGDKTPEPPEETKSEEKTEGEETTEEVEE
jgi:hypothetical protein